MRADESPADKARDIAWEQTVELPVGVPSAEIQERMVARIESLEPIPGGKHRAVLSYNPEVVGGEVPQLVNVIFGNISLKTGIKVVEISWPDELLTPGPGHGIPGLRKMARVTETRPLVCAALKPMGLSPTQLAEICRQFALGGVDFIKDDHGLANQTASPYRERVERCQAAVEEANRETGGSTSYFPNVSGPLFVMAQRRDIAVDAGCRGVLLNPFIVGLDAVRWIRESSDLAILAHPALSGGLLAPDHGIAVDVLMGQLLRVVGADGSIYINAGGRFPVSMDDCHAINRRLREPLGDLLPALPTPGGGISVARVPYWMDAYGPDTMFLIGGSFYATGDVRRAVGKLLQTIRLSG